MKLSPLAVLVVLSTTRPAVAQPDLGREAVVIAGAAATAALFSMLPIHEERPLRDHEWLRLDDRVRDNYSSAASLSSDIGLSLSIVVPAAFAIGASTDDGARDRSLVLGESLAITLAATSLTKVLVGRPRPYAYGQDPRAIRKAASAGRDAYRSFFSGHAAMAFASASTSGLLYAGRDTDTRNRALVFGTGAFLAASTANLRIRAGKHFYSDVVFGAVVGTAIGTVIPALHTGTLYAPSGAEWAAMGAGMALGVLTTELLPFGGGPASLGLSPLLVKNGGGIAFGGTL